MLNIPLNIQRDLPIDAESIFALERVECELCCGGPPGTKFEFRHGDISAARADANRVDGLNDNINSSMCPHNVDES